MIHDIPPAVISAYQISPNASFERVSIGLINITWVVQDEQDKTRRLVLQKLNRIFDLSVNSTIAEVSAFLADSPARTTQLIRTDSDALQVVEDNDCWRCLSYVPGRTYAQISNAEQAVVAGKALANFHAAMSEYPGGEDLPILTVHDLAQHQNNLATAIECHKKHRNYSPISCVAEEILLEIDRLPDVPNFKPAILHGDPKITNFIFDEVGATACLIDLDTIGRGQILYELGDAFRSWCNPHGEETEDSLFDLDIFARGIAGYMPVSGIPLDAGQSKYIGNAIEMICLELAARFCADALNESYFAWDSERYLSASEHQLVRAKGQLNLAKSVAKKHEEILEVVKASWR